jgi:hypothetical protein
VPPADRPIVVWHLRGATLALPLEAVEEIVAVGDDGRARGRAGVLEVMAPPGLEGGEGVRWAVVVRGGRPRARGGTRAAGGGEGGGGGGGGVALGADLVEGVVVGGVEVDVRSEWLGGLDLGHLKALLRLDDGRLVALLDLESLFAEP